MTTLKLRLASSRDWLQAVLDNFDDFLLDHAAAEKKASGMAMSMLSHYPDRKELVLAMADLAIEELSHYREVIKWIHQRGLITGKDQRDSYVLALREHFRRDSEDYFLDRLLIGGIIEARGAERFGLIAEALTESALKQFYQAITRSEQRHNNLFIELAELYFPDAIIETRLDQLLDIEAKILSGLPVRPALH